MEENKLESPHFFTAIDAVMVLFLVLGVGGYFIHQFVASPSSEITTIEQEYEDTSVQLSNDIYDAEQLFEGKNYVAARQLLAETLTKARADFVNEPDLEGRTLLVLSEVALAEGDLPLATDWASKAVTLFEQVSEVDSNELWRLESARQQRILVSLARNDHDALIVDYQALTDFYRKQDGDQPSKNLATNLQSLALEYLALDDYTQAESHYLETLIIAQKLWEPDSVTLAVMANDLGVIYKNLNKLSEAKTAYEQSLATWEKLQPAEKNNLATTLENYAFVLNELNDPATAATYDRAQTLKKEIADEAQP